MATYEQLKAHLGHMLTVRVQTDEAQVYCQTCRQTVTGARAGAERIASLSDAARIASLRDAGQSERSRAFYRRLLAGRGPAWVVARVQEHIGACEVADDDALCDGVAFITAAADVIDAEGVHVGEDDNRGYHGDEGDCD